MHLGGLGNAGLNINVVCFYLSILQNNTGMIFLGGVSLQRGKFAFDIQEL